jgi:hypothetical protein
MIRPKSEQSADDQRNLNSGSLVARSRSKVDRRCEGGSHYRIFSGSQSLGFVRMHRHATRHLTADGRSRRCRRAARFTPCSVCGDISR